MTLVAYAGQDEAEAWNRYNRHSVRASAFSAEFIEQARQARTQAAKQEMNGRGLMQLRRQGMPEWARQITAECADRHDVFVADIAGDSRRHKTVRARNEAMYLVKSAKPMLSSPQMARWFNRDHTSVLYALASHSKANNLPMLVGYDLETARERNRQGHHKRRTRTPKQS